MIFKKNNDVEMKSHRFLYDIRGKCQTHILQRVKHEKYAAYGNGYLVVLQTFEMKITRIAPNLNEFTLS